LSVRYAVPPPPVVSLPILGSDERFPVHRIFCVGRNYAEHAREMGYNPEREAPFFFMKAANCIVADGGAFPYPEHTQDVHHEIELVVALKTGGRDIAEAAARDNIFGYAVGLDMTRRDIQSEAKRMARPWDAAKAFDHAAPCSAVRPAREIGHPESGSIWLDVNGASRQRGDLKELIWKVPEIIAHLSALFTLAPGDLIFTGTPAGVAAVKRGDRLSGGVEGIAALEVTVT